MPLPPQVRPSSQKQAHCHTIACPAPTANPFPPFPPHSMSRVAPAPELPPFGGSPPLSPKGKQKISTDTHQQPARDEPPAEVLAPLAHRAALPSDVGDAPGFIFSFLKEAAGECVCSSCVALCRGRNACVGERDRGAGRHRWMRGRDSSSPSLLTPHLLPDPQANNSSSSPSPSASTCP